jgi:hypothetical protein
MATRWMVLCWLAGCAAPRPPSVDTASDSPPSDTDGAPSAAAPELPGGLIGPGGIHHDPKDRREHREAEDYGPLPPLPEAYVDVRGGYASTCALGVDGQVVCFGCGGMWGKQRPPRGLRASQIDVDRGTGCALTLEGKALCWGLLYSDEYLDAKWIDMTLPPADATLTDLGVAAGESCAIALDQSVTCWGGVVDPTLEEEPSGRFVDVGMAAGGALALAIDEAGELVQWGDYGNDLFRYPEDLPSSGPYVQLDAPVYHGCALGADGHIDCWPGDGYWGEDVGLEGEYLSVTTGGSAFSCALGVDHRAVCWGVPDDRITPPDIEFQTIDAGSDHVCGVDMEGQLHCWGADQCGETQPPVDEER